MHSVQCIATEHETSKQAEASFNAKLSEAKLNVKVRSSCDLCWIPVSTLSLACTTAGTVYLFVIPVPHIISRPAMIVGAVQCHGCTSLQEGDEPVVA